MAVAYLLTPCTGFPIDTPHSSAKNFDTWLSAYISASSFDDALRQRYTDTLRNECSGNDADYIFDVRIPEVPITAQEEGWIDEILSRMAAGENFDKPFRQLYQRLLKQELITPSEIITALHTNQGG